MTRPLRTLFQPARLLLVARLAILRGKEGPNWTYAIEHAFTNRMSTIDSAAINQIRQRESSDNGYIPHYHSHYRNYTTH
jgi:hypothetical protein